MASEEELRREEELLRLTRERVGINSDILQDVRDISNVLNDQVRQLSFEKRERTEIRNIAKETSKIASESYNITVNEIGTQKQLAKLTKDKNTLSRQLISLKELESQFSRGTSKLEKEIGQSLKDQILFTQNLIVGLKEVEEVSRTISENVSVRRFRGLATFVQSIPGLKAFSLPFKEAANNITAAVTENEVLRKETEKLFKTGEGLNRQKIEELGLTKELEGLEGASAAKRAKRLGLDKKVLSNLNVQNTVAKETLNIFSNLGKNVIGGIFINSFLQLNKSQTEFRRLTGESATNINVLTDSLISANDQIKTLVSLTEQFGLNANVAFDAINIQEATELVELLGLSAEEANNLALFAQASGTNLKIAASNIYEGVDAAFSQKRLLQDIGNVSSSIAITFGGNLELMGKTANEAKRLGLNLEQVDKIAESLLDIESSIAREFEAEVVTGRQINLERARFFALTNNLNGLTQELGKNQEVINSFATGTRIEQQAIADAIGLSRDEISQMIFQQAILDQLTTKEAATRAGMSIEDAKRLSLQQSITKSVEKLTEALAGPLEAFAALADNAVILYTTLGLISTISLAKTIGSLITMATTLGASAAFASATSAALTLGLGAAAIVGAIALIGAAIASASKEVKQSVQDGIAPSTKGPFTITDKFGAMAVTAPGDSLFASPNIIPSQNNITNNNTSIPQTIVNNNNTTIPQTTINNTTLSRENRNINTTVTLTEQDIRAIANAVKEGAMEGTSKANVQAVIPNRTISQLSTRIQPELAINTYKSAY